jgi:glucokinase
MAVISLDIGGTKIAGALLSDNGSLLVKQKRLIENRKGDEVGEMASSIVDELLDYAAESGYPVTAAGICIPGIVLSKSGTVWAPNIPGWDNYPLIDVLKKNNTGNHTVFYVESDRTCHILGEVWKGAARGCSDALMIAVGTGIGVGIISDGHIVHGHGDIAGAAGWMALETPYSEAFGSCGCFEYYASGNGIGARARDILRKDPGYSGQMLKDRSLDEISAYDVFQHFSSRDPVAVTVLTKAIEVWGMASANLVSLLNPEVIIWGGGIFGPAAAFIGDIYREAVRWAQPVSIKQVSFVASQLGEDAGLYGAARLAMLKEKTV